MASVEAATAAGQTAEQKLALAHKALLNTRGIQFDFQTLEVRPPPAWATALGRFLEAIAPGVKYVFWGGLIVGGALIIWFVLRETLPDLWPKRRTKVPLTDWRPEAETARALLEDADRLAGQGRFEEAIHLLLFRSIDDLSTRRPGLVKPALTSRDIAGLETIPPTPREAFARLARAVETTFFGGRPAGEAAFGEARRDYEAFAFAEGWR